MQEENKKTDKPKRKRGRPPGIHTRTGKRTPEQRKLTYFRVMPELDDLLNTAVKNGWNRGQLVEYLLRKAVKSVNLGDDNYSHTLIVDGDEVATITTKHPKVRSAFYRKPKKP